MRAPESRNDETMKATTYLISRAIAALCLLATAACVAEDSPAADDTTLVEIGQTAPDFTVEMTKGGDVTLSDLRGPSCRRRR